jgi:hypothetical protein
LHQFVEGGALRARSLEFQLKPKRAKQLGDFGKAQFPGASVFQRVERSPADAGLARKRSLAEFERFAPLGDLAADGDQVKHCAQYISHQGYLQGYLPKVLGSWRVAQAVKEWDDRTQKGRGP